MIQTNQRRGCIDSRRLSNRVSPRAFTAVRHTPQDDGQGRVVSHTSSVRWIPSSKHRRVNAVTKRTFLHHCGSPHSRRRACGDSVSAICAHPFGSLLIQDGASLIYVKEQMGHSSIQTTVDTYRHLILVLTSPGWTVETRKPRPTNTHQERTNKRSRKKRKTRK